jgi:hypothetical protein
MCVDVLSALEMASLAVLQKAKFTRIGTQNQATLWPVPCFASVPNVAPVCLQDIVSL